MSAFAVPTILSDPFVPSIRFASAGPANVRINDARTATTNAAR